MKLALAIICSFLLAGTPLLLTQAPVPVSCAGQVRACCQHGVMPCCQAKSLPDSQPAPAAPAPAGDQSQLSLLAPGVLLWILPATPANSIVSISTPSLPAASAPLYALDCARLI